MSIATPQSVIVRAGAGAGKTHRLTEEVLRVARSFREAQDRWPSVIVTTFTKKATEELRERLLSKAANDAELTHFIEQRGSLHISTIHAVFDLFLRRFGQLLGLDTSFIVQDDLALEILEKNILRQHLQTEFGDLLVGFRFNEVYALCKKILECEWAGDSGASSIEDLMSRRTDWLRDLTRDTQEYSSHLKNSGLLELADYLDRMAQDPTPDSILEVRALLRWPTAQAKKAGLDTDDKDAFDLLRERWDEVLEPAFLTENLERAAKLFTRLEALTKVFGADVLKKKIEKGWLSIGDLELVSSLLLQRHPEAGVLFSGDIDHWLVDEFQDTSPMQVGILQQLMGSAPRFFVGDPQQSIYLFRGARSEVFFEMEKSIEAASGNRELLLKNYRSAPRLMHFLNDLFSGVGGFQRLEPRETLDPKDSRETPVASFVSCEDEEQELNVLVSKVQALLQSGEKPEEICVLSRTNKLLQKVAKALYGKGIPTVLHSSGNFEARREILDLHSCLRFLANPWDNENLLEVLRTPWFLTQDILIAETLEDRPKFYWQAFHARSQSAGFESVLRLQKYLDISRESGVVEALWQIAQSEGFFELAYRHDYSGRRESNLWKWLQSLDSESRRPGFNVLEFLNREQEIFWREKGLGDSDAVSVIDARRVQLMTVHASKGLQFDHVLLPDISKRPRLTSFQNFVVDDDRKWSFRIADPDGEKIKGISEYAYLKKFQQRELEEHFRVLYVALTRAKRSVFLTWYGKTEKHSWLDRMKLELSAGEHHRERYSYFSGTADEMLKVEPSLAQVAQFDSSAIYQPWSGEMAKLRKRVSVTEIVSKHESKSGAATDPSGKLSDNEQIRWWERLEVGVLLHRIFEALKHSSGFSFAQLAHEFFPDRANEVTDALQFVVDLEDPPFKQVLQNGYVEWGFVWQKDLEIIEGQVDLWGILDDGELIVIDYKTGSPEYRDQAFRQLDIYAQAIHAHLGKNPKTQLVAVYPFQKKVFKKSY